MQDKVLGDTVYVRVCYSSGYQSVPPVRTIYKFVSWLANDDNFSVSYSWASASTGTTVPEPKKHVFVEVFDVICTTYKFPEMLSRDRLITAIAEGRWDGE